MKIPLRRGKIEISEKIFHNFSHAEIRQTELIELWRTYGAKVDVQTRTTHNWHQLITSMATSRENQLT